MFLGLDSHRLAGLCLIQSQFAGGLGLFKLHVGHNLPGLLLLLLSLLVLTRDHGLEFLRGRLQALGLLRYGVVDCFSALVRANRFNWAMIAGPQRERNLSTSLGSAPFWTEPRACTPALRNVAANVTAF